MRLTGHEAGAVIGGADPRKTASANSRRSSAKPKRPPPASSSPLRKYRNARSAALAISGPHDGRPSSSGAKVSLPWHRPAHTAGHAPPSVNDSFWATTRGALVTPVRLFRVSTSAYIRPKRSSSSTRSRSLAVQPIARRRASRASSMRFKRWSRSARALAHQG